MASKSPLPSIYYKQQKAISSDMDQEEFIPLEIPYLLWPAFSEHASLALLYFKDKFSTVFPLKY